MNAHLPLVAAMFAGSVGLAGIAAVQASNAIEQPVATQPVAGLPLHAVSEPIALVIAGQSAVLHVLRSPGTAEQVIASVHGAWQRQGALVRRADDRNWLSVSRVGRDGIDTLQLRDSPTGGSDGYLVGWKVDSHPGGVAPASRLALAQELLPRSAITLSDLGSSGRQGGRTIVAWLPSDIGDTDRQVLANASKLGLSQYRENRPPDGDPAEGRARFFRTVGLEVALSLHREGAGTALVIHLTEALR